MTLTPASLPRSFSPSTNHGECPLCESEFERDGSEAFYATVRRDSHGNPIWNVEAQVAPKDARGQRRPQGCTCRGRRAHTPRCALYQACSCPTVRGGRGSYVKHRGACSNKIQFNDLYYTLPGFFDHCVHVDCAAEIGLVIPAGSKRAFGRRVMGRLTRDAATVEAATGATVAQPAPAAPSVTRAATAAEVAQAAGQGVANAASEAAENAAAMAQVREETRRRQQAAAGWMGSFSERHRAEREAAIRARAEQAERVAREREQAAQAEREAARAESEEVRVVDLEDSAGSDTLDYVDVERFAGLDLD